MQIVKFFFFLRELVSPNLCCGVYVDFNIANMGNTFGD